MPWGQSAEILKHVRFIHRIIVADSLATPFTSKKKLKMCVMHNIIKCIKDFKKRREQNKKSPYKSQSWWRFKCLKDISHFRICKKNIITWERMMVHLIFYVMISNQVSSANHKTKKLMKIQLNSYMLSSICLQLLYYFIAMYSSYLNFEIINISIYRIYKYIKLKTTWCSKNEDAAEKSFL